MNKYLNLQHYNYAARTQQTWTTTTLVIFLQMNKFYI